MFESFQYFTLAVTIGEFPKGRAKRHEAYGV